MKKPQENQMRKKVLVKALGKNLDKMSKSPWVRSLKEGKDLICPFCDQPVQPCKTDPSAMCERMLLYGTEGKELEDALKVLPAAIWVFVFRAANKFQWPILKSIQRRNSAHSASTRAKKRKQRR